MGPTNRSIPRCPACITSPLDLWPILTPSSAGATDHKHLEAKTDRRFKQARVKPELTS